MTPSGPVYVISGQLSAGKSTVAKALLAHFPRGYHIDVDGLREMVTSGLASPLDWSDETTRQFELAIRGATALARVYSDADFAVAIEGGLDPGMVDPALSEAGIADRTTRILLNPRLEVALERNRSRTTKSFDTAILEGAMREIDADLASDAGRAGWHAIDNSDEEVETTVERALALAGDAG